MSPKSHLLMMLRPDQSPSGQGGRVAGRRMMTPVSGVVVAAVVAVDDHHRRALVETQPAPLVQRDPHLVVRRRRGITAQQGDRRRWSFEVQLPVGVHANRAVERSASWGHVECLEQLTERRHPPIVPSPTSPAPCPAPPPPLEPELRDDLRRWRSKRSSSATGGSRKAG
jgi:hypothetical protein